MKKSPDHLDRRGFIKTATTATASFAVLEVFPLMACGMNETEEGITEEGINIIGPKKGFSPHVGTLVSMMDWMRMVVLSSVQKLTTEQLDYLNDEKANTIGSLLLHLAATEKYYQLHTFEGKKWGTWDDSIKKQWDIPMQLGPKARETIKGNDLNYYLTTLREVREQTITEFKKRDDKWLMAVDKGWPWGPTNNYCKWFHVCEHESNHNGQIKWLKSRLPGATANNE